MTVFKDFKEGFSPCTNRKARRLLHACEMAGKKVKRRIDVMKSKHELLEQINKKKNKIWRIKAENQKLHIEGEQNADCRFGILREK